MQNPEKFDVLVTTNLFGDILSDISVAELGGLGLAPSLNSGERYAMAQSVHGAAPDIAGKGIANPVAEILSTSMLLSWMASKHNDRSLNTTALTIETSVAKVLMTGDPSSLTVDLGGDASTKTFTETLLKAI